jgi:predicted O-linked N-acetylglucosamine transferase (SPINDLY family)
MGVPVITLAGDRHAARVGASLLECIGAGELVARSEQEYVDKAVALARDPQRIAAWRGSLRDRVLASPLADSARFTRDLEGAYLMMLGQ